MLHICVRFTIMCGRLSPTLPFLSAVLFLRFSYLIRLKIREDDNEISIPELRSNLK
jgi:hypothetical protein